MKLHQKKKLLKQHSKQNVMKSCRCTIAEFKTSKKLSVKGDEAKVREIIKENLQ